MSRAVTPRPANDYAAVRLSCGVTLAARSAIASRSLIRNTQKGVVICYLMPDVHTNLRSQHGLLGDEHLEVAVGSDRLELLGVRGVSDFAVKDHDFRAYRQRRKCVTEGGSGGDLFPNLIH